YVSNLFGDLSATSPTMESQETIFHQDLNGDGVIGINLPTHVIEAYGSTSLVEVGTNYYMDPVSGGTGPELKYGGAPVVDGQFGVWAIDAAEATSTGYEVALKDAADNLF